MKKFFFDFWNFFLKMVRLDYFSWIELWWMRDNEEEIKIICIWSRNIYTRKRDGVSRKEKVTFLSEMLRPDSNFQFSIYQSRFTRYYSSKNRRISLSLNITQYSNTISRNIIRDFLSTCRVCSPRIRHNWICEQSAEYIRRAYEFQQRRVTAYFGCVHVFHNFPQLVTANGILLQQAR